MKRALLTLLLAATAAAQTPDRLSFALPDHPGTLSFDQGPLNIVELSARPDNSELGIRAESPDLRFLGFLFIWPGKSALTAESCREDMFKNEHATDADVHDRVQMKSASGAEIALAAVVPKDAKSAIRAFVADGSLCADLLFSVEASAPSQTAALQAVKGLLNTLTFDPHAQPTFSGAFAYATVEFHNQQFKGAAIAYRAALDRVDTSDNPIKWRRVTTDQLSMSLGISGDLKASRAVNQAAIAHDPTYPLYYYNLACADAEEGNAEAARTHLQAAFDRRANTLPGEKLPDPATDDSILKLKSNKDFWLFVQSLNAPTKKS